MAEQHVAPIRPTNDLFQRRAIGGALGAMLAMSPALALAGFWNWLFFFGVPVVWQGASARPVLASLMCFAPAGVLGVCVGLAIAWSEQGRRLGKAFLIVGGLVCVALVAFFWNQLQVALIIVGVLALLGAILLVFRQIVEWIQQTFRRSARSGYVTLLIVLGIMIAFSVMLNWAWLQFPLSDEGVVLAVHRHALAQGWQVQTLELADRISGVPDVRVRRADGLVMNCRLTYGLDKQAVKCKP